MKHQLLDIKGNSLDDGPGIRTVVFFQGCPLSCIWCHNPESKSLHTQISYDPKECIACNDCIKTCQQNALSRNNPYFINRELCNLCFECIQICPSNALSCVGKSMELDDIVSEIEKDLPFFQTSGGGVTFSGGEPTLSMDFLSVLLQACKAKGIHTLLETCGYFLWKPFVEKVLPHVNMIYYDIKIVDPVAHKKYCGKDNQLILDNFVRLKQFLNESDIKLLPRTPLIPKITATKENLTAIATFFKKNNIIEAQLMEYNPLWLDKNMKIGISNPFSNNPEMNQWMDPMDIQLSKNIFLQSGIHLSE
jgi:pyruvate formate lyase activating enzyme